MGEQSQIQPIVRCNSTCPVCCQESLDELNARLDAPLRVGALILSGLLTAGLLYAYCYSFIILGKILPIPDLIWPIIAAPWCGAGMNKLIEMAKK